MKSLIKTVMKVFLTLSIVLCVSGIAMAYTFDSEIDPKVFVEWEIIDTIRTGPRSGFIVLKNPDLDTRIKEAQLEISRNVVRNYEYSIDGKVYKYQLNMETNNYDLVVPEE